MAETWSVYVDNQKISSNLESTIMDYISANVMKNHWHRRKRIGKDNFSSIDWAATEMAMKSNPHSRRWWIT
jgi:hypothetical protein